MNKTDNDLYSTFRLLDLDKNSELLAACELLNRPNIFLARTHSGSPIFLVKIEENSAYKPSRILKYLTITYNVQCCVKTIANKITANFITIECNSDYPELFELFVTSCNAILGTLPNKSDFANSHEHLQKIIDLFMKISEPASQSIAGLWGELLIIAASPDPIYMIKCWHNSNYEKFDFATPSVRIDVKATELSTRIHDFSLEQLIEIHEVDNYIISVKLRRIARGTGIIALARKISNLVSADSELVAKVWSIVTSVLGTDFSEKIDILFDEKYAINSTKIFPATIIPRPSSLNPEIFSIRFKCNFSSIEKKSLGGINNLTEILGEKN